MVFMQLSSLRTLFLPFFLLPCYFMEPVITGTGNHRFSAFRTSSVFAYFRCRGNASAISRAHIVIFVHGLIVWISDLYSMRPLVPNSRYARTPRRSLGVCSGTKDNTRVPIHRASSRA